ncbi:peroxiredoxin-1-like [Paramacrobiotus metropolitanus]|uniref:peroxiredoxin-1-like n=1 Tax=Paramacrobiotus metropolitanus TaxID=2943436 RepID=UPI0024459F7C|nr:peroxiredoxin-1-like [Paramacrobiotus metropolitanus]XP_055354930.1 peroxiredoxin-1-like [Paramacrobiotus metropolitanus]
MALRVFSSLARAGVPRIFNSSTGLSASAAPIASAVRQRGIPVRHLAVSSVNRLPDSVASLGARVQHRAPNFKGTAVVNGAFKPVQLSDYDGKWLIMLFYPLDFTFVCPTEIVAFSDRADEFANLNTQVVAISTDSHFSHLAWTNVPRAEGGLGPMKIALLSDFSKQISRDYGVLIENEGIALRGMFIIDPKGVLRQVTINDLPVGRSVDEAVRLVQAFQFVEKHGEVCPAGWLPKSETIKPDPVKAKEYFKKVASK